ncbi:MAG: DNA repair protein RecO [Chloroflexota bacterium]|nr:DNA repair protein RecO [Chloroflexota bacterium]
MSSTPESGHTERQARRIYRCEAIVLSRSDFGEADRVITVYSRQHGKLRLVAKGARRPLSRLGPHLEYFCRSQLMLVKGRDLDVVTGAETVNAHLALRSDLDAYGHASHMVELVARLTEERQENAVVFDVLAGSLQLLAEGIDPYHVTRHFELALLNHLGYRPQLQQCIECREPLTQAPHPFMAELGGYLCERCQPRGGALRHISVDAQKYLRAVERGGLGAIVHLRLDPPLQGEIERLLSDYLRHISERDLSSLRVWRELGGGAPQG